MCPEIRAACKEWTCREKIVTAQKLANLVNASGMLDSVGKKDPQLTKYITQVGGKPHISERTGKRWLRELGLKYVKLEKGVYVDGHERADVVAHRTVFLKEMLYYSCFMTTFEFMEDGSERTVLPTLQPPDGILPPQGASVMKAGIGTVVVHELFIH